MGSMRPKVGGQQGPKFGVNEAQILGSFWPKFGGQRGLKFGVNEAQILGVNRAKIWDPMVDFNKAQRLASTRPKFGVNEVKIWGQ